MLAVFDEDMRRHARADGPDSRVERTDGVVRQVGQGWNGVVWSDLDHSTVDAAIAAQVRYFTALGRAFEWKMYAHDQPADLPDRLRAAGFVAEPDETLMVAETRDLSTSTELPDGVHLRPVIDAAGAELMAQVHDHVFGTNSSWIARHVLPQLAEEPATMWAAVVMAADVPVSAARMEMPPGAAFASLWGGGTVSDWRGRGIYRALVALRARIAAERGYRYLQVDASSQSRPILQRLGFVPLTTTTPYVYTP